MKSAFGFPAAFVMALKIVSVVYISKEIAIIGVTQQDKRSVSTAFADLIRYKRS